MKFKKSQITLFIIIGLIILFATSTYYYITHKTQKEKIELFEIPKIEKAPEEIQPIQNFITNCLKETAKRGLIQIGKQGGYISLNSNYLPKLMKSNDIMPTDADYVRFSPRSNWKIPYWHYLSTENTNINECAYESNRPPLKRQNKKTKYEEGDYSIEAQLDYFIEQNIDTCFNKFKEFKKQGFEIKLDKKDVNSFITEKDIKIILDMNAEINLGDQNYNLNKYYTEINLPLKKIYELGTEIVNNEINYSFLERNTLSLITGFSGLDENKLPPMHESEISFNGKIWSKTQSKLILQNILATYVRALQVMGSKNFKPVIIKEEEKYSKTKQQLYNNMILPIKGYEDLDVRFDYLNWWPIYFDVNSDGELIKSEGIIAPFFSYIGFQNYNTQYDLSYPALVEISIDQNNDFKDGYKFYFMLENNIRVNKPLECNKPILFVDTTTTRSLFCDEEQALSGNISIKVLDDKTKFPLNDVAVTYGVAGEACNIGLTNNNGTINKKFPLGFGGIISLNKLGYEDKLIPMNTELGVGRNITINMLPLKKLKVKVEKISLDNTLPKELSDSEEVIITLKKKKNNFEKDFIRVIRYKKNIPSFIELIPGDYEINGMLLIHNETIIPEETRKYGSWPFKKKIKIPAVKLPSPHNWGGIEGDFKIDNSIYVNNEIIFKVIELPQPRRVEDLNLLGNLKQLTLNKKIFLIPRYK